jgi:CDGSH-type Zn-finger protein
VRHAVGERPTLGEARSQYGAKNNEVTHAGDYPPAGEPCRYIGGMSDVTITPKSNGPLIIEGPVRIVTPQGQVLTPPLRKDGKPAEVVVLCRCGGSATKPFCDGTHKRNGFQDGPVTPA